MSAEDLAKRLQVLEDIEAIKKLKAQYCAYCDAGYDPDGIAGLFTENAIWDGGTFGKHEGRAAIHTFFAGAPKVIPFAVHNVMNPIIEVDGDKATGQWYLFQPCTMSGPAGDQATWGAAKYSDDYARVGGEWRIHHLRVAFDFWTPYEKGWVKQRLMND